MRAVLSAFALLCAAPAFAQQGQLDPRKSADQVQRYIRMLTTCETQGLADLIDPEVSTVGLRGAFAQSRPVYVGAVQQQCNMGVKLNLTPKILRHSEFDDMALSVLEMQGSSNVGGRETPADLRLTLVLRKGADGVWRILHSQTATAF